MHEEHHGFIYGVLSAFVASIMFVFVKLLMDLPVTTIVFTRFFIGLIVLSPWLLHGKHNFSLKHLPKHLIRDLSGLAGIYCFFYALQILPIMNAATLSNTSPLFIPLVVLVALKLVLPKQRIWALVIGFLGVLLILQPGSNPIFEGVSLIGLASGLLSAIAAVYIRQLSRVETTTTILLTYFITATAIAFIPMILFWEPIKGVQWVYLGAVGTLGTLSQYLLTKSYTHAPASKASLLSYLGVVFGGLFGWLIWGEVPSIWGLAGALLIILGGTIALLDKSQPRKL